MFPLGVTFPVLAFVVIPSLSTSLSTPQPPDLVPHNTPTRVLPTVPVNPVVTPVRRLWTRIGSNSAM
jgi:hypothetical protein